MNIGTDSDDHCTISVGDICGLFKYILLYYTNYTNATKLNINVRLPFLSPCHFHCLL